MIILITILIILASFVLGFFILIQNPKGGGLSGSFGSLGAQVMGVKQSSDAMEKGTWTAMGVIAGLCLIAIMFYEKPQKPASLNQPAQQSAPAQQQAPQGAPVQ